MANIKGVILTVLISQTAWLVLYYVDKEESLRSKPLALLPVGCIALVLTVCLLRILLPPNECSSSKSSKQKIEKRGLLYYTCCLFSWSCIVDGIFYLEVIGTVKGFMASYYLTYAEPYLGTSFGTIGNIWDATVHYFFYLQIIYYIDNGKNYRNSLLMYLGCMIASMIILLIGGLSGSHGGFYPCTLLNTPYLVLPIYFLMKTVNEPRNLISKPSKKPSFNHGFLRFIISCGILVTIGYSFIRGIGALNSPFPPAYDYAHNIEPYLLEPSKLGAIWVLAMLFIGLTYLMYSLYALYHPGCVAMLDWSLFFASFMVYGSVVQFAQFCPGVAQQFHPSDSTAHFVIAGNVFVGVVSVLIAWLVHSEKDFFLQPVNKRD